MRDKGGEPYDEEENLLIDRETLARIIGNILGGGPCAPDVLAGLFVELRQGIEGGLQGICETRETLRLAVELAYLHTRAHSSAVALYGMSKEGQLRVEDEPARLIDAAIERTRARARPGARARRG